MDPYLTLVVSDLALRLDAHLPLPLQLTFQALQQHHLIRMDIVALGPLILHVGLLQVLDGLERELLLPVERLVGHHQPDQIAANVDELAVGLVQVGHRPVLLLEVLGQNCLLAVELLVLGLQAKRLALVGFVLELGPLQVCPQLLIQLDQGIQLELELTGNNI